MRSLLTVLFATLLATLFGTPSDASDNLLWGVPGTADQIIDRDAFAVGYSARYRQPLWVSYRLTAAEVTNRVVRRDGAFRADRQVEGGSSVPEDYCGTGYDRGHLAPAADMLWSTNAMLQSFLMSNMSPQRPAFNRGIWGQVEAAVRRMAVACDAVTVVTGPFFAPSNAVFWIGFTPVRVPDGFYKVVLDERVPRRAIGFLLPNAGTTNAVASFAVSVDDVERATGLDFFSELPDEEEERIEGEAPDASTWRLAE